MHVAQVSDSLNTNVHIYAFFTAGKAWCGSHPEGCAYCLQDERDRGTGLQLLIALHQHGQRNPEEGALWDGRHVRVRDSRKHKVAPYRQLHPVASGALTWHPPLAGLVPLDLQLQKVAQGGHVDESQLPHLLHVHLGQVLDMGDPQPTLGADHLLYGTKCTWHTRSQPQQMHMHCNKKL